VLAADFPRQFHPVHAGHEIIGDDGLDFGVVFQHGEGVFAGVGLVDVEFVGGKQPHQMLAHGGGIVHHQDMDVLVARDAPDEPAQVVQAVGRLLGHVVHDFFRPDAVAQIVFHIAGEHDGRNPLADHVVHDAAVFGIGQMQVEQGTEIGVVVGIFVQEIAGFLEIGRPAGIEKKLILDFADEDAGEDLAVLDDEHFFHRSYDRTTVVTLYHHYVGFGKKSSEENGGKPGRPGPGAMAVPFVRQSTATHLNGYKMRGGECRQ